MQVSTNTSILCPIWLPQSKTYIFTYMWILAVKSNLCGCMLPKDKCKHQPRQKPLWIYNGVLPDTAWVWVKPNTAVLKNHNKMKAIVIKCLRMTFCYTHQCLARHHERSFLLQQMEINALTLCREWEILKYLALKRMSPLISSPELGEPQRRGSRKSVNTRENRENQEDQDLLSTVQTHLWTHRHWDSMHRACTDLKQMRS